MVETAAFFSSMQGMEELVTSAAVDKRVYRHPGESHVTVDVTRDTIFRRKDKVKQ